MTSSDNIEATFKIPFSFPLSITKVAEDINIQLPQGHNVANLKLPLGDAQTISPGLLKTAYSNQPLKVNDDSHDTFNQFSKILTTGPGVQFFLSGTADTVAETAAGAVTIPGVAVNVASTMAGMNLNVGGASITDIKIVGGTSEYLEINQNVVLQNPSGLTVKVGDVAFNIGYAGNNMGRAVVKDMILVPGNNTLPAVFHMSPSNEHVRDGFLTGFVAGASFTLDVAGAADSTKVESLKEAMASVKMASTIKGITDKLIPVGSGAQPNILEMLQMTAPRKTPVQVMIYNPFDTPLFIKRMKATNYWQSKYFGELDEEVNLTVPPKSTVRSPTVTMVSPAGLSFMGTLIPFMSAYPQMLLGIPFDVQSTILTYVGGQSGYFGNVGYNQTETIIKVQVGGKAPAGALPAGLAGLVHDDTNNSTTTALPSPTTTTTTGEASTSTATASTTGSASAPTATATGAATEPIVKRQVQTLEDGPGSEDPAVVEAWIKAMVNKLAADQGLPPYY
ncbi:hypothetical protein BGZ89_005006 [Linnemannia elongata]|nr:hypothetical protein BGZ89_005006 [Linnemannia elongata]